MKKEFLILFITVFSVTLSAQDYYRSYDHHDISLSYGLFQPDQFKNVESAMLDEIYPDKRYSRDEYSSTGGVFLTYRHMFRNELFLW